MEKLVERFLKYVKIDTKSDPNSDSCPSTKKQLDLARVLVDELEKLGLKNVSMDDNGYVMATLPSNIDKEVPTIGFIAHMDTSPDMTAENVKPRIVKNYDGEDIVLNEEKNIVLSPKDFPELKNYKGEDLITTDGTTLLGADDKAGIAEIMTAIEYLSKNPHIKHGTIKVGFTPDEEIGSGADKFDVEKFDADLAYTVDGGQIGELEYENFNAAYAKIKINGRNVHPGTAKNKMINAITIAMEFNSMLPPSQVPEYTEGYEGFYHLHEIKGNVEEVTLEYIIRDHDNEKFEEKKEKISRIVDYLNESIREGTVELEMKDQYYNMKKKIAPVMYIVETAKKAMEESDVKPIIKPIRGGTDGARLSYMGLPCPNLFTGGHNFHGKFEYIPIDSMGKSVEVILKIIELYTK
ncbi:peptidase T [Maledivibacter halophilus]|uniref:Peptidase T n=1 Tax=Maledivibacter halophilus TaxID=36842 RepID=A0A1T5IRX3_9FIRM|nr:peptidase T [Maledivibacter halophilus]SKC41934.1 peptidase T. Metallo peptidase. MEROPS family M20B [Maledivibacter halophilus]